jgi:hypothetical protein
MNNCYEYVKENGGIELRATYPFTGTVIFTLYSRYLKFLKLCIKF